MIHEEICTYDVCRLAKEKGFDVPTDHYYYICDNVIEAQSSLRMTDDGCTDFYNSLNRCRCAAPTQSLLQRWLREEKAIAIVLQPYSYNIQRSIYTWIYEIWADNNLEKTSKSFKTYELALEDALKYALENLV